MHSVIESVPPSPHLVEVDSDLILFPVDVLGDQVGNPGWPGSAGYQAVQFGEVGFGDGFVPVLPRQDALQLVAETLEIVSGMKHRNLTSCQGLRLRAANVKDCHTFQ